VIHNHESLIRNALRASKQLYENSNLDEKIISNNVTQEEKSEKIDLEKFYETINLMKFCSYSPFSKLQTNLSEKSFEGKELIIKAWTKLIKEMNTACFSYTKSVELFASQLSVDKDKFGSDKEIPNLLALISQSLKDYAVYTEMFARVVENSIYR